MLVGPDDEHDHASAAVVTAARPTANRSPHSDALRGGARGEALTLSTIGLAIVPVWMTGDIHMTSKVAAWLENLQASDAKTADLVDDAIYALSRSGPHSDDRSSTPSPAQRSRISKSYALAPAAPARSASCSSSTRGVQRSCRSPVTSPGSGANGTPRPSREPNSSMRSTLRNGLKRKKADEQLHQVGPRRLHRPGRR